jgi:hypothetical protein
VAGLKSSAGKRQEAFAVAFRVRRIRCMGSMVTGSIVHGLADGIEQVIGQQTAAEQQSGLVQLAPPGGDHSAKHRGKGNNMSACSAGWS